MGKTIFFLSVEEFKNLIAEDAFVEYEEVYQDKFYGTLKSEVERIWQEGKVVIFDVDVKGRKSEENFRRKCPFYFYCTTFYRRIGTKIDI